MIIVKMMTVIAEESIQGLLKIGVRRKKAIRLLLKC